MHKINIFLSEYSKLMLQKLMEADVDGLVRAPRYARTSKRLVQRNGYRLRVFRMSLGSVMLRVPKLRRGTYYPSFLARPETTALLLANWLRNALEGRATKQLLRDTVAALDLRGVHSQQLDKLFHDLRNSITIPSRTSRLQAQLDAALISICQASTAAIIASAGFPPAQRG